MSHNPDLATERRAQIIEAALACFTRKGYVHTTMDDIVAESGLSKGSIYWYFKSKDEIFKATVVATAANVVGEQWDQFQSIETATAKLQTAAQLMSDFCQEIAQYFGLVLEFWSQSERRDEEMRFWAEMLSPYQQTLAALFKEGIQTGEFREVDADALAWIILSAYDGLAVYSMMMPEMNVAEVSKAFIDTLLKGLQADE
ncbi:MAG: TetR/AcrR family transcriptional regulator [Anaerolineae bacterium]